jgi:hypothetical protein
VQSLGRDGVRLTFRPEKLTGTTLRGTSDVLGAKIARLFVGGGPQYVDQLCAALDAVLTPATGQGKSP